MIENYLPWAFRLVALGLVSWTLFCVLRKLLRRSGVIPYPPFKSREEYLEAALEMNLEDFIGRAKATPRSVTQKPLALKFPAQELYDLAVKDVMSSVVKTVVGLPTDAKRSDFFRRMGAIRDGMALALKKEGFGGSAGARGPDGAVCSQGLPVNSAEWATLPSPFPTPALRQSQIVPGKWYRVKETKELVRACRCDGGCDSYDTFSQPLHYYSPAAVEPAYPKGGEVWRWTTYGSLAVNLNSFIWNDEADNSKRVGQVRNGILEPVNFGKGEKNQA